MENVGVLKNYWLVSELEYISFGKWEMEWS